MILKSPALGMIWIYQTFISPRKGYRCAYSVVHGGTGCSGYAKHRIRDVGVLAAIPDIRQRLKDCSSTASERRRSSGDAGRRRRGTSGEKPWCSALELFEDLDGCSGCDGYGGCD